VLGAERSMLKEFCLSLGKQENRGHARSQGQRTAPSTFLNIHASETTCASASDAARAIGPSRAQTLTMDYGDGGKDTRTVNQGSGAQVFTFSHSYCAAVCRIRKDPRWALAGPLGRRSTFQRHTARMRVPERGAVAARRPRSGGPEWLRFSGWGYEACEFTATYAIGAPGAVSNQASGGCGMLTEPRVPARLARSRPP
jgi:hypothetical protein